MSDHLQRRRYAIVGTGGRAEMFARALIRDHPDTAELVAFADVNQARMDAHNRRLAALNAPPVATYQLPADALPADVLPTGTRQPDAPPADAPTGGAPSAGALTAGALPAGARQEAPAEFRAMLDKERVDTVLVTTVDRTHDAYIVAALDAGRDVITEKPMTVDAPRCRRILDAARRSGRRVTVTFNYRYNPVHAKVRELLASGVVGEIGSVHFEWLLDVRHGADYFRRWHRDKANSGGLLVHKATHHFDLVNWWLGAAPEQVYAASFPGHDGGRSGDRLFFYGPRAGARHGYARDYDRAHGAPAAAGDPFALQLADNPGLRELYLDAEHLDGYHRDQNVFGPGITIEDDMAVLVRYSTGATMTYHLTAYAPWEGYRIAFNGSGGRLELEVVESDHVAPAAAAGLKGASLHGEQAAVEQGWVRLQVRRLWRPPEDVPIPDHSREGHGGADARMTAILFGADPGDDPLGRGATERDGAMSLLTGLAANESLVTGRPVQVADLLDLRES